MSGGGFAVGWIWLHHHHCHRTPHTHVPAPRRRRRLPPQVDFFTSPAIKEAYRGFVHTITSRVNTINGRRYSDDPTIMAWDLLNE